MSMLASMPYPTAAEAIAACQEGEVAIRLDGMNLVLDRLRARRGRDRRQMTSSRSKVATTSSRKLALV